MFCSTEGASTVTHTLGGRGYCLARKGIPSGCYQWKIKIVKDTRGNEGVCVGISVKDVKDYNHLTTTDMWLYRSYNGSLYHNGEVSGSGNLLPEFSVDDVITVQLDMDEGHLSFAKNDEPFIMAFDDIPVNSGLTMYPVVTFYTNNQGEKVQMSEMVKLAKGQPLFCAEPICSPPSETLVQAHINVLRRMMRKSSKIQSILEETLTTALETKFLDRLEDLASVEDKSLSKLKDLAQDVAKEVWPCLSVLAGSVDSGLKIGSAVSLQGEENQVFLLGSTSLGSANIKVVNDKYSTVIVPDIQRPNFDDCWTPLVNFLTPKMFHLMLVLSGWCSKLDQIIASKESDVKESSSSVVGGTKKKSSLDKVSLLQARDKPRSSSLPDPMAASRRPPGSGVELLTDQLVSSIMGEVITGNSSIPGGQESGSNTEATAHEETETAASGDESDAVIPKWPFEKMLLQMASVQNLAKKIILGIFDSTEHLLKWTESIEKVVQLSLESFTADPVKSIRQDRADRALAMIHVACQRELVKSVIDPIKQVKFPIPTRETLATMTACAISDITRWAMTTTEEVLTPIHSPLRDMGFDNRHITQALNHLRVDGQDTSAQAINQCATWMIDHPHVASSVASGGNTTNNSNYARGMRAISDIRNYLINTSTARVAGMNNSGLAGAGPPPTPPWESSFRDSLSPSPLAASVQGSSFSRTTRSGRQFHVTDTVIIFRVDLRISF